MQSSACQNSGRTPNPVPPANCKPDPWSTWQTAYPSHYGKMNNHMRKQFKANPVVIMRAEQLHVQWIQRFPSDYEKSNFEGIFGEGNDTSSQGR